MKPCLTLTIIRYGSSVKWSNSGKGVQILDEIVYISHSVNTFEKSINPTILLPAPGKIVGQTMLFSIGVKKENSAFKPIKLHLKIDLVSYPVRAEGW